MSTSDARISVESDDRVKLACSTAVDASLRLGVADSALFLMRLGCSAECRASGDATLAQIERETSLTRVSHRSCIEGPGDASLASLPELHPTRGLLVRRSLDPTLGAVIDVLDIENGAPRNAGPLPPESGTIGFVPRQRTLLVATTTSGPLDPPLVDGRILRVDVGEALTSTEAGGIGQWLSSINDVRGLSAKRALVLGRATVRAKELAGVPTVGVVIDVSTLVPQALIAPSGTQSSSYVESGDVVSSVFVEPCGENHCLSRSQVELFAIPEM